MRPLDQALEPDARWRLFMVDDPVHGFRQLTFADHYAAVLDLDLPDGAEPLVRRLYESAQNCLRYAWLDYELMLLAEAQVFSSLDRALQSRINDRKVVSLAQRLRCAVREGWISPPPPPPGAAEGWRDTHRLIVGLRNDVMHGSAQVHDFAAAAAVFRLVRKMISELATNTGFREVAPNAT